METRTDLECRRCLLIRSLILVLLFLIPSTVNAAGYIVRPGDSLSSIAAREHSTVSAIASANGIANPNVIQVGRYLTIPGALLRPLYYRVRWGDTLSGIAARNRVSVAVLRSLNPQLGSYLLAGSLLRLCSACTNAVASTAFTSTPQVSTVSGPRYVVQEGDTLSGIAARYGVSPATIVSSNGLSSSGRILAGSSLLIPGAATVPTSGIGVQSVSSAGPYSPLLARSLIAIWARTYGISSSLPLAIGWQESGFNQALVSSTGAVGVMQIEPYTATRISGYLGRTLNLNNLNDNIQAGVFWLTHLLVYYGWNVRMAVAAYYQGSKALASYGLFADTVQYVNSVLALRTRFGG